MAKRRRSARTKRRLTPYQQCMSREIPKQRQAEMKRLRAKSLTQPQHQRAFKNAINVCKR